MSRNAPATRRPAGARPGNGIDAVRAYRLRVENAGTLAVSVVAESGGPILLELLERRASPVASAQGAQPTVSHAVEPGVYVSRSDFRVRATLGARSGRRAP